MKELGKVSTGSTEDGKTVCSLKQGGLKRREKDIPDSPMLLIACDPKELAELANFSVSRG